MKLLQFTDDELRILLNVVKIYAYNVAKSYALDMDSVVTLKHKFKRIEKSLQEKSE